MCIALFSTEHPEYALIVASNRDEFLNRPTKPADWWDSPNEHVLGGRDLLRSEQGTWFGITRDGRIAVLTNFREEGAPPMEARSRGGMVNAFLTPKADHARTTEDFVEDLIMEKDALKGTGGFSLVCGAIGQPLAVVSNRTPAISDVTWIAKGRDETVGLSNALITDRSWPKVVEGERLVVNAVRGHAESRAPREQLTEALFQILSNESLPRANVPAGWDAQVKELRKSIFIPKLETSQPEQKAQDLAAADSDKPVQVSNSQPTKAPTLGFSGPYGTQKQTVLLVSHVGTVYFTERSLNGVVDSRLTPGHNDRSFQFEIANRHHNHHQELGSSKCRMRIPLQVSH